MDPFKTKLAKTVTQFLNIEVAAAEQKQKPPVFILPRWAKQRIFYLARQRGVSTRSIFHNALMVGLEHLLAEGAAVKAWHTLTPKECEVAAFICMGLSNEEIGAELSIAISTVKAHIGNIFQKFGVENRTQLQHMLAWWNASVWLAG